MEIKINTENLVRRLNQIKYRLYMLLFIICVICSIPLFPLWFLPVWLITGVNLDGCDRFVSGVISMFEHKINRYKE